MELRSWVQHLSVIFTLLKLQKHAVRILTGSPFKDTLYLSISGKNLFVFYIEKH